MTYILTNLITSTTQVTDYSDEEVLILTVASKEKKNKPTCIFLQVCIKVISLFFDLSLPSLPRVFEVSFKIFRLSCTLFHSLFCSTYYMKNEKCKGICFWNGSIFHIKCQKCIASGKVALLPLFEKMLLVRVLY